MADRHSKNNPQYKSGLEFVAMFQFELIYSKLISVS